MIRMFMNFALCTAIVLAGVAATAAILFNRPARSDATVATEVQPTAVEVSVLEARTVQDRITLTGSIEPWEDVTLSAETRGTIEWMGVDEGQAVREGQELLRIDTESIRVRLEQARAQHKLALQELARVKEMEEEGISSPQALDRALTDREVSQSNLRVAELELAHSVITAPFDGVVDTLHQERGEYLQIGAPLVRLVQVHKVKKVVGIPEKDITFFSNGDPVLVAIDAIPGETFEGTIHHIATTADMATHTFATEIELANPTGRFKPGMIARSNLIRRSYPEAISVPIFTVITLDDQRFAFIEKDGVARMQPIEVGFYQKDFVHVTQGLQPGDRLIVSGQHDLRDGDPVRVREEHE